MNPAAFLNVRKQMLNTGPVNPNEVREIVALDLMQRIAAAELARTSNQPENPREYLLTLYSHCLQIVSGEDPEEVLEDYEG